MSAMEVLFLSREDVDALESSLEDMLAAVETGLDAHGRKNVLLPSYEKAKERAAGTPLTYYASPRDR